MLQPGVKPLRIYDQGSQNQVSYNQGFLQQGALQARVLTTRGSYNKRSYNGIGPGSILLKKTCLQIFFAIVAKEIIEKKIMSENHLQISQKSQK